MAGQLERNERLPAIRPRDSRAKFINLTVARGVYGNRGNPARLQRKSWRGWRSGGCPRSWQSYNKWRTLVFSLQIAHKKESLKLARCLLNEGMSSLESIYEKMTPGTGSTSFASLHPQPPAPESSLKISREVRMN